jgi:uncharacterized membrane protein (UPF0127 family)
MKKIGLETERGGQSFSAWRADRFWTRLRGLMGRTLRAGDAMLLSPCGRIHSFFMKSPIDVVYLSRRGEVLGITPSMRPNTVGKRVRGAYEVLELYDGDAAKLGLAVGSRIIAKG